MKVIEAAIEKLSKRHEKHIKADDHNESQVSMIFEVFGVYYSPKTITLLMSFKGFLIKILLFATKLLFF